MSRRQTGFTTLAVLLAIGSLHAQAPAPTVSSVSPTNGYNHQTTTVTIRGAHFVGTPIVRVGAFSLTNVVRMDSETLSAAVPAELPAGTYAATVTNPDAQHGILTSAFTVLPSTNGTLGNWQAESSMPSRRSRAAVVAAERRIYVISGISGLGSSPETTSVLYANVLIDGSLGAWTATTSTPKALIGPAAAAWNGSLYVLGGVASNGAFATQTNAVYRASINPDGSLGGWQSTPSMNRARSDATALAINGYLYAVGGISADDPLSVERATINPDGSLSAWTAMTPRPHDKNIGRAVAAAGSIYFLTTSPNLAMDRAVINPDGTLGEWTPVGAPALTRASPIVVSWRGVLYVTAGRNYKDSGSSLRTEAAVIQADGSLGTWHTTGSAWQSGGGMQNGTSVDGVIYAIGGEQFTDRTSIVAVERALMSPVSFAVAPAAVPSAAPASIAMTGLNLLPGATLQLGTGVPLPTTFVSTTQLTATVPAGLAGGRYTATLTNGDGRIAVVSDALAVDDTPPAGTIGINADASVTGSRTVTLTLTATDNLTGVVAMAFSNDGTTFSAEEPYATTKVWTLGDADGTHTVYARFRDGAGNVSAPASDAISLNRQPPSGTIVINGGALTTLSPGVTLQLSSTAATVATTVTLMSFSADGVTWEAWEPYSTSRARTLAGGNGVKSVYVRFQDSAGNTSGGFSEGIELDTTPLPLSITINGGALFTSDTAVTLTLGGAAADTWLMLVSNDGGFAGATWEPYAAHKSWTITSVGSHVLPRVVYARFRSLSGAESATVQDDIVLDTTPPSGSLVASAPSGAVTLSLSATDDLSGVASMAIGNTSSFAGAQWEPYATSKSWVLTPGGVFARFRDTAGNLSDVITPSGTTQPEAPFGVLDIPAEGASVSGAIAVSGWALDDRGVSRVRIYRAAAAGDSPDADGNVYIGDGVFVSGARPDVQAAYATMPGAARAGWGYMMLTHGLPNGGNGAVTLRAYAEDGDGNRSLIGQRTIVAANATATLPFGTIDTPAQGATVSGQTYNFGWALTPGPKAIPVDGSTITVYVDGQNIGHPNYGHFRSDVAGAFPGLANSGGAVGFLLLDTSSYADGLHTIGWTVSDNSGAIAGIGSRYFETRNYTALRTTSSAAARIDAAPIAALLTEGAADDRVMVRIGFDDSAAWTALGSDGSGTGHVRASPLDRLQLRLGRGFDRAEVIVGRDRLPLPVGARFEPATGLFTWQPGPAFAGTHRMVFSGDAPNGTPAEVTVIVEWNHVDGK